MLNKNFLLPKELLHLWEEAKGCSMRLHVKRLEVFKILASLYRKAQYSEKQNQESNQNIFGFKVTGYDYHALLYLFREVFLSTDYEFTAPTSAPVIVDCGANIGFSVLYFKMLYPNSKIHAFEPNPYAFQLLEKNVSQNHLEGVNLYNFALSDLESSIPFYLNKDKGTLHGSLRADRGGETEVLVKTKHLSQYFEKIDHIDLVKIDVEGAEIGIIKDLARSGLISKPNQYIIEYHHKIDNERGNLSPFLAQFENAGFDYNIKAKIYHPGEFQDVILKFFK